MCVDGNAAEGASANSNQQEVDSSKSDKIKEILSEYSYIESEIIDMKFKVPTVSHGAFNAWISDKKMSDDIFNLYWSNDVARKRLLRRLRRPGGYHEWLMVARTNVFFKWKVVSNINDNEYRSSIDKDKNQEVKFFMDNNVYNHTGTSGSSIAHNEILKIIDDAFKKFDDNPLGYEEYVNELKSWSKGKQGYKTKLADDYKLPNGF